MRVAQEDTAARARARGSLLGRRLTLVEHTVTVAVLGKPEPNLTAIRNAIAIAIAHPARSDLARIHNSVLVAVGIGRVGDPIPITVRCAAIGNLLRIVDGIAISIGIALAEEYHTGATDRCAKIRREVVATDERCIELHFGISSIHAPSLGASVRRETA